MIQKKYEVKDKKLATLKSTSIPNYFIFFDTETKYKIVNKLEKHVFKIGWSCLWDRLNYDENERQTWKFWNNGKKMCEYFHDACVEYGKIILIAHNVYFDLQVSGFFRYFTLKGWKLRFIYDQGSAFILKAELNGKTITCLSTTNWFDQPLKYLGEIVGLPKLEIDLNKCNDKTLKNYCRRDVEILVRIMSYYIDFISNNDLGKFSYTKASQAFNAYRFRFMPQIIRIHVDEKSVALERGAYMGGRCECFFLGNVPGDDFVTLDINSMYPYVMRENEYPYRLVEYIENPSIIKLERVIEKFAVIAECEITTPENVFPVIYKTKTIVPRGTFSCFLCSSGLKHALEKGYINKLYRMSVYEKANLFESYVNYFHELREKYKDDDNEIMKVLCKYMSNSLYGKWGQKYQVEERTDVKGLHDYYREEILDIRTNRLVIKTWLMNQQIVKYDEKEGKYSFVAIAAHVTENARMLLWKIMSEVGMDKILYCDTDSFKILQEHSYLVKHPIEPKILGALKIEDISHELKICGNKFYITEKNKKIKGIPKNAIEVEPGVFEFFSWPKMTAHLREGIITGYNRKKVQRRVSMKYDKGVVQKNGIITPFNFPLI